MAKLEPLAPVENIESQTTLTQALQENFDKIEAAFTNTVSRDASTPNFLLGDVDMNSYRIMNLPSPQSGSDPARWQDVARGLTLTEMPIPDIAGNSGKILSTDGLTIFWSPGAGGSLQANLNLSDLTNKPLARTNLGLGTAATYNAGTSGSTFGLLNANLTFSGSNTYSGTSTFTGPVSMPASTAIDGQPAGYRNAPPVSADNNIVFQLEHAGKGIKHTSGAAHIWGIANHTDVPFPLGTTIVLDNMVGGGIVTVGRGSGVSLRSNGSATSADQSLGAGFVRTLYKVGTNDWVFL